MTKQYKLINNAIGWVVFAVAAVVYLMTIEPTASFWDCGEFITQAYKLEVGHPPGAPIFMLVGNLFTQFASDPSQVAKMINTLSALLSAFTILFLFWTITHLTRKLVLSEKDEAPSLGQTIAIMGSGLVGALAYTFSDTFWFSAVEGEVYAFSSMLTALVFWLILKWEDNAEKPDSDKWIVLIAYVMGLSIGVHLLNLLCIPAIVLVYYYKKQKNFTWEGVLFWKGVLVALLGSFGLIAVLMFGVIPGFTKVGGWFELFFVNTLGMPYNSGVFVYFICLVATIVGALYETMAAKQNEKRAKIFFLVGLALAGVLFIGGSVFLWLMLIAAALYFIFKSKKMNMKFVNLTMSSLLVILIGFSAYAIIPIRSSSNPPLDLNSPEDVFSLGSYLNREQYGQTPLLYGSTYASDVERDGEGRAQYSEKKKYARVIKTSPEQKDRYVVSTTVDSYKYTNSTLFPRMHSNPANPSFRNHIQGYQIWGGVVDKDTPPTMFQNLRFLFSYQINYMYWRYFMWNFSGRQNDIQGDAGITKGNWITGIPVIDEYVLGLGPQDHIAPDVVDNKGRNVYFMLPFLLGLIGLVYQLRLKDKGAKSFSIVFMLFFMTGLAIVLYLNQTPFEPRERDYAYAGSFYAYAIWIGIGVAGIGRFLREYIKNTTLAASIATVACLFVPVLMGAQNWDDHDRSGRYLARDTGFNYLSCVEPGGIIFTNGDNDTYPLWYSQETEGFRTDVRVCNLSFLNTEWYIDQMLCQSYESLPLPIKWPRERYYSENGGLAYVITKKQIENALKRSDILPISYSTYYDVNSYKDSVSLAQVMENLRTGKNASPKNPFLEDNAAVVPSNLLYLDADTTKIDWKALNSKPSSKMQFNVSDKNALHRQELMILEMLSNINAENWNRSISFATTVDKDLFLNMTNNFTIEGLTYRITPGKPLDGGVNVDAAYDNMMNKFRWGGLEENPDIYLDETGRRMISAFRTFFLELIDALVERGDTDRALAALDKCVAVMPDRSVHYGTDGVRLAEYYFQIGQKEKGAAMLDNISARIIKNLDWYQRLKPAQIGNIPGDIVRENLTPLLLAATVYHEYDAEKYQPLAEDLLARAQFFYMQGFRSFADIILKEITDGSIRAYHRAADSQDTTAQKSEETMMQRTLQMMNQFNPKLLEQYNVGSQSDSAN
ncbi:MAG: DUF2723 domain-containing protein [Dysgonamonadaceae bacterium]|jgi:hypothetical protein|nr:DUF2723 domain-containing protein [Dysgonamonadaceae bacterium]